MSSCVSESEHNRIVEENNKLKTELEELKFGAPNLLADGKMFFEAKEYAQSRIKLQTLVDRHSNLPESIEARKLLVIIEEEELWQNVNNSNNINDVDRYIESYPKGKYISKARSRRSELKIQNMQQAYTDAVSRNSSYTWKKFLEDYPDHYEAESIKEKIIRLEVDEITNSSETGRMPSFNNYSSDYSSNSTVEITNNTGCNLTVRYSGPEAIMIEIPSGGTRTVYLSSGSYKIAASACGSNYAGNESLHGKYGSTFYIRRY